MIIYPGISIGHILNNAAGGFLLAVRKRRRRIGVMETVQREIHNSPSPLFRVLVAVTKEM